MFITIMVQPIVNLKKVAKVFPHHGRTVSALREVDLTVEKGDFVAVMGPSGAGKSTLLHLIAGLDSATDGEIIVEGKNIRTLSDTAVTRFRRRRIGMIYQTFNLLEGLTLQENVALPLLIDGRKQRETDHRTRRILEKVGLSDRADHRPDALSGGEQQRGAIARALIIEPAVILADEPTGNLDRDSSREVLDLMIRLVEAHRSTLLMVTHEQSVAIRARRLLLMKNGRIGPELSLTGEEAPDVVARWYQSEIRDPS